MLSKLENIHKPYVAMIGLILILGIGLLDFSTGHEISFSLFYLIPIFLISWFLGKWAGIVTSIVCALTWLTNETVSGQSYSHPGIYYWNSGIRLGFFIIVTLLLTKLKDTMKHDEELARFDYLTGAANIRNFYDLLQRELDRSLRYKHPFTIAYLDLDNFKLVNDQYGHQAGDRILTTIVRYAMRKLRSTDVVARLGGDEFVILLPETGHEMAKDVIPKIQSELLEVMQENQWPITFSIGVLTCENTNLSSHEVVKIADDLMCLVKRDGKNAIRYSTCGGY
jgi:diguanylate cyclase (GGDEF)-like protein